MWAHDDLIEPWCGRGLHSWYGWTNRLINTTSWGSGRDRGVWKTLITQHILSVRNLITDPGFLTERIMCIHPSDTQTGSSGVLNTHIQCYQKSDVTLTVFNTVVWQDGTVYCIKQTLMYRCGTFIFTYFVLNICLLYWKVQGQLTYVVYFISYCSCESKSIYILPNHIFN